MCVKKIQCDQVYNLSVKLTNKLVTVTNTTFYCRGHAFQKHNFYTTHLGVYGVHERERKKSNKCNKSYYSNLGWLD